MSDHPPTILSVLTLNLFGQEEPLEAIACSAIAWLTALAPDVIALQEVRQTTTLPNQAATIARALGMHYEYALATRWGDAPDDEEGLALLSRWPLTDAVATQLPHATDQERRICLHAHTESPVGPCAALHDASQLADDPRARARRSGRRRRGAGGRRRGTGSVTAHRDGRLQRLARL